MCTCSESLQSPAMLWWHRIPCLWCPKVQVVDAVEIHVFRVPPKCCLPHAEVQVGCVHALDLHPIVLVDSIEDGAEVVDIPVRLVSVGQGAGCVGTIQRVDEGDVLPVLAFQLLHATVPWRAVPAHSNTTSDSETIW